jgi:hypothetical protein
MEVNDSRMFMDAFFYYTAHQQEIIKDHLGDYVVIQGNTILGYYKNRMDGLSAMAKKRINAGTYIVHKCRPVGEPDMTVTDIDFKVVPAWKH